jgi:tetratricopeptide (TPR) repeat protein
MGKSDKAKMYFDLAIKYYPESANVYDSMADFFERNNDFVSALKFATQAYEIQESEYFKQRIQKIAAKIKE